MTITKFKVFYWLEHFKKITAVANYLHIKQPTVSFHLKSLEKQYGVKLFYTSKGHYVLTEAGYAFYHYVKNILQQYDMLESTMTRYREGQLGLLKIGSSSVPAADLIPNVFHSFLTTHPQVQLSLEVATAPKIEQLIINHTLDCAIIMQSSSFKNDSIISLHLGEDEIVVAFPPEHPFSEIKQFHAYHLENEIIIIHKYTSSTKRLMDRWLFNEDIQFKQTIELDSVQTIKTFLQLGSYVTLISKRAIQREIEQGKLKFHALPTHLAKRELSFIRHRDHWEDPLLRELHKVIQVEEEKIQQIK